MLEFKIFLEKKLIQRTMVSKGRITIGRSAENDVVLPNKHVSRLHAVIEQVDEEFRLQDHSTNGILLNGKKIPGTSYLPLQSRLEIYPFVVECLRQEEDVTLPIPKKTAPPQTTDARAEESQTQPAVLSYHYGVLVGESPSMQRVYRLIEDVAHSPATVLIRGDHGTGKELVARAIHEASPRRSGPFVAVNCAAIPLDLIESELFGYDKGAFTGAQTAKKGKAEEANGGTLFLDEIGELSPAAQAKLLRFLQSKTFMRLGSAQEVTVDARVVAATNKNLEQAVRDEAFRADLYYRIKVVQITLPPLRERPDDILLLSAHILEKLAGELRLSDRPSLTEQAMKRLQAARWPGNVRQLENILYSAVVRSKPPHILDEAILMADSPTWTGTQETPEEAPIDAITKKLLLQVLKQHQWDTAKAAAALKVSRGTIYYKLKKFGIDLRELSRKNLTT